MTSLSNVKGTKDIHPADKQLQIFVTDVLRDVFELFGYQPLETPITEKMEVLTAKFAAGEGSDVLKEIFSVTDQAKRKLGLRFDMTVPLCRYVAMNPHVRLPFKRYVIGRVYRDGPIKLGRYREFWQADADIVGVPGALADAEGLMIASEVFRRLDLDATLYVSSRELLSEIMDLIELDEKKRPAAIIALDKLKKIGADGVQKEMMDAGVEVGQIDELMAMVSVSGSNTEKISGLRSVLGKSDALDRLEEILGLCASTKNIVFDASLARGLGYYTGFFFEALLNDSAITSSLVGTGRYDNMIGDFLGSKKQYPAVGISFGVSVLVDALKEKSVFKRPSNTVVYGVAVSKNELHLVVDLMNELRKRGVAADWDYSNKGMSKNFSYADTLGIPYVVVLGENEVKRDSVVLKDLRSGEQTEIPRMEFLQMSFDEK
jgi:histidyl-tRNA synthetase